MLSRQTPSREPGTPVLPPPHDGFINIGKVWMVLIGEAFQTLGVNPAVCLGEKLFLWVYYGLWVHEIGRIGVERKDRSFWLGHMSWIVKNEILRPLRVLSSFTVWTRSSYLLYPFFSRLSVDRRSSWRSQTEGFDDRNRGQTPLLEMNFLIGSMCPQWHQHLVDSCVTFPTAFHNPQILEKTKWRACHHNELWPVTLELSRLMSGHEV